MYSGYFGEEQIGNSLAAASAPEPDMRVWLMKIIIYLCRDAQERDVRPNKSRFETQLNPGTKI